MKSQNIERDTLKRAVLDSGLDKDLSKARFKAYKGDRSDLNKLEERYPSEVLKVARNIDSANFLRYRRVFQRVSKFVERGEGVFLTLTFNDDALKTDIKTRRVYVARCMRSLSSDYVANIDYGTKSEREHYHGLFRFVGVRLKNKLVPTLDKDGKQAFKDGKPLKHLEAFYIPACFDDSSDCWLPVSSLPGLANWSNTYGFISCKACTAGNNSAKATSKYVGKNLTAHALKESTSMEGKLTAPRIIYSRKNRKF